MKFRKYLLVLLISFIVSSGFSMHINAYDKIETDKPSSISIEYKYEGLPVNGATFNIYYLASVDEFVNFTLTPEFSSYPVSVDDNSIEEWNKLAETLKGYVIADKIEPLRTVETDDEGKAVVDNLATGLYLVVGEKCIVGDFTYYALPAIISLPSEDADGINWIYDVEMNPKCTREFNYPDGEETMREVRKIWNDKGHSKSRPKEITVELYADGILYDTVILNVENNWYYCWDKLPQYDETTYSKIEWTIVETTKLKNYTVRITIDGKMFIVNNKYKTPGKPDNPPDTGVLWWPVPVLLCMGIIILTAGISYRRRSN